MDALKRIKNNTFAYDDYTAWLIHEGLEENEDTAQEYIELLEEFNPLNIKL